MDPDCSGPQPPPNAVVHGRASNFIRWIGFSTGKKTEPSDFILIDEVSLGELGLMLSPPSPAKLGLVRTHPKNKFSLIWQRLSSDVMCTRFFRIAVSRVTSELMRSLVIGSMYEKKFLGIPKDLPWPSRAIAGQVP